jgi:beta-phosphoglucomutase-like phosphatase (HAD superfamily)
MPDRASAELPDGVIFDMDGLMFDTERVNQRHWVIAAREFGFDLKEESLLFRR